MLISTTPDDKRVKYFKTPIVINCIFNGYVWKDKIFYQNLNKENISLLYNARTLHAWTTTTLEL